MEPEDESTTSHAVSQATTSPHPEKNGHQRTQRSAVPNQYSRTVCELCSHPHPSRISDLHSRCCCCLFVSSRRKRSQRTSREFRERSRKPGSRPANFKRFEPTEKRDETHTKNEWTDCQVLLPATELLPTELRRANSVVSKYYTHSVLLVRLVP